MIEIRSIFTGEVIYKSDAATIKLAVEASVRTRANLRGADLIGADLRYADLRYADLRYADLRYADLRYADLRDAGLRGADLRDAGLRGADLRGRSVCPSSGAFIAWKKCSGGCVVKLQIPAWARRVSALCGRKCRAEFAIVLSIENNGKTVKSCLGQYDPNMVYEVGKIMKPDEFDPDRRVECSHGIHFFMEYDEAINY
jgi:hypothetical protein